MKQLEMIHKILSGNCTETERQALADWINLSPTNKEYFEVQKTIWENAGKIKPVIKVNSEAALAHFKLKNNIPANKQGAGERSLRMKPSFLLRIAAGICLFVVTAYFFFNGPSDSTFNQIVNEAQAPKEINLADGSLVTLNKATKIGISEDFNKSDRKLSLSGEAYFNIKKGLAEPFIIQLPEFNSQVKVIGTRFNLNADPNQQMVELAVEEGTVEISILGKTYVLKINDFLVYNALDGRIELNKNETFNASAWHTGKLIFKDTRLADVLTQLQKLYGGVVRLENSCLAELRLSSTLPVTPELSLLQAVKPVSLVFNLTIVGDEQGPLLLKGSCQ